ncbi:helix-turn-helix domain-containing protein [Methylobacterium sp. WL18]|uniref:helix-turn-helix domain-containing protein n=1 Tax=unclassified Methylobacterium TaxID=2615210 RepID=UPI0011C89B3F|nr:MULTISPECIES: helix-turn-helix domain-containing protein [unclassified Methylobacterium]TXN39613.1 helix-turn-helix domain-containing protein [Methylobacterium sp. WL7]TXN62487.1 helix-turn-helix domain-containing protein [Methylobacterium sp. WL18]
MRHHSALADSAEQQRGPAASTASPAGAEAFRSGEADAAAPAPGIACLRFEPPGDPAALGRAWQAHLAPVFAVSFGPETDLTVPIAMRSYHLGELLVGDVIAPAHILERSPEMIRQQGLDHILLQFYRRGQSLVETDHDAEPVGEVQCIVFDLAQPVRIVAGAVDATNVVIPRVLLEKQGCHPDALHGRPLDHDGDPFGRLVHSFVANVVACGDRLDQREALAAAAAITQLCATWLRGRDAGNPVPHQDVRIRVRRFIEAEFGNPKLSPALIAARLGLSRSTLYRVFAPNGIVSYIRDRRLMHAMRMLVRDEAQPARVSRVAFAVGFSDERTFRRAFKRRFGFIPSDAAQRPGPGRGPEPLSVLQSWIESL